MRLYVGGDWRTGPDTDDASPFSVMAVGFTHGLGLFETLRVQDGHPLFWREHWERLANGARLLQIPLPLTSEQLGAVVTDWLKTERVRDARLKYFLWAGPAPEGEAYWSPSAGGLLGVQVTPDTTESYIRDRNLCVHPEPWRLAAPPYKPIAYAPYLLARREASLEGFDDALLLDDAGRILESTSANILWERRGKLETTPAKDGSIIPGTVRKIMRECINTDAHQIEETYLKSEELADVDAIWMMNAYFGVSPVASIEGLWHRTTDVTRFDDLLKAAYERCVENDLEDGLQFGDGDGTSEGQS